MISFSSGCGSRADRRGSESSSSLEAGPSCWALEDAFPPPPPVPLPRVFPASFQGSLLPSPFLSCRAEARLRQDILGQSSIVGIKNEKNK